MSLEGKIGIEEVELRKFGKGEIRAPKLNLNFDDAIKMALDEFL